MHSISIRLIPTSSIEKYRVKREHGKVHKPFDKDRDLYHHTKIYVSKLRILYK